MIVFDPPRVYADESDQRVPRCFRSKPSAHLFSTVGGARGEDELLAFAKSIGMRSAWVQKPGTPDVHFDIVGRRIERARMAGAQEVSRSEAAEIRKSLRLHAGCA